MSHTIPTYIPCFSIILVFTLKLVTAFLFIPPWYWLIVQKEVWLYHQYDTLSLSICATKTKLSNFSDGCSFSLWPRLIRLCKKRNVSPTRFLGLTYAFRDIFRYILTENLWNVQEIYEIISFFNWHHFFHDFHYYLGFYNFLRDE